MLPSVSITTSSRLQDAPDKGAKRQQERKKKKKHMCMSIPSREVSLAIYIFFCFFLFHKLLARSKCRVRHNAQQGTL